MDIRVIDQAHAGDINLPNQPFPLRGRMTVTYSKTQWGHGVELFPPEQVTEMVFPEENYVFHELKDSFFLGAYDGETCVGLALLQPQWNGCLYVSDLKVCLSHRGRGVGRMLIKAAEAAARERDLRGLSVICQDNNLNACLFYLACGFSIGGLDTHVYKGTGQEGKSDIYFYRHFPE